MPHMGLWHIPNGITHVGPLILAFARSWFVSNNKTLLPDITGALRSAAVMLYDPDATAWAEAELLKTES